LLSGSFSWSSASGKSSRNISPSHRNPINSMNICLVSLEWPPHGCGIGTYMYNLVRGLSTQGHNVTVITHDREPVQVRRVKIMPVPLPDTKRTLWSKVQKWRIEPYHTWSLMAYKRFQELSQNEEFDIIETADFGAWGRHFVGQSGIPIVVRCHSPTHVVWSANQMSNGSWKMPLWLNFQDKYEREQTFRADGIISPSYALANHLSLSWVIPRSRFAILPNPIDAELFRASENNKEVKNEILYVGRLEYNKGVFDLAESVRSLLKKYPDIHIRFIGMDVKSPQQLSKYGNKASEVILSLIPREYHSRVIFTSHVPVTKVVSFQQKAMCAVMPTRGFESFSYTVLEPMSCGCPVVATHCGGPTEIITDGVDGLLVPPDDTVALTEALERLIKDQPFRDKLASQARRTVKQRFAIPIVVPKIVQWYEHIIQNYKRCSGIV